NVVGGSLRRITGDGVLIVADSNTVAAYDGSGALKWQTVVLGVRDVAIGPEEQIYVSTAKTLAAFDKNTGAPLWTPYVANDANETSSLAIGSDGTVFFHTGGSGLSSIERLS